MKTQSTSSLPELYRQLFDIGYDFANVSKGYRLVIRLFFSSTVAGQSRTCI